MTQVSFGRERLILANPADPRILRRVTAWDQIVSALRSPDFVALVTFCIIGLLVTIAFSVAFPGFGG